MSVSEPCRVLRTPKRCNSSSRSNLSTSTPVNSYPIINVEPLQSPIEQKSVNNQTAITPIHSKTSVYNDKLRQSLNNNSISRYLTRSQSKILNVSVVQNISKSDDASKPRLNTNHCVDSNKNTKIKDNPQSTKEEAPSNVTRSRRKPTISSKGNVSAEAMIENIDSFKTPLLGRGRARERRRCRNLDINETQPNKSRKAHKEDDKDNVKNNGIEENMINEKTKPLNEISHKSSLIKKRTKSLNNIEKPTVGKTVSKESNPNSLLSDDVASGESCNSTSNRNSDNFYSSSSFKPSFIRRKLYSRSSDFTENDSKQINTSFLEKKNVRSVYPLKTSELSGKKMLSCGSNGEEAPNSGDLSEDTRKSTDNLRQYCLRKNNNKHFNRFFGENNNQIINDVIDGVTKENTCEFVSNLLKDINNKNIPLTSSSIPDKTKNSLKNIPVDSSEDLPNRDVTSQAGKKISTERDTADINSGDDCFEIFSRKISPGKSSNVIKAKSNKVSKPKLPTKYSTANKETIKKIKATKVPVKVSNNPKKKSIEPVKLNSAKVVKRKSSNSLSKSRHPTVTKETSKNDGMLVLQEKKSYNLRKSVANISDKYLESPELKAVLNKIQTGNLLKQKHVSSKKSGLAGNRSLEISITSKTIILQSGNKKSEKNIEKRCRKEPDHTIRKAQENCNNNAVVFKHGKLVLPGKFGESAATSSSSFLNSFTKIHPGEMSSIKINYKTNFNDIYRGIHDFEKFERFIYNKASVINHIQKTESFFNRTAADIARETRQHREHSKYIFKNPSNVLWNQKPSIESTICQSRKYDSSSNSIFASSFKAQSNKMIKGVKENNFDISTKYGLGSSASVFGKNRNTTVMSGLSELDRKRMINKQIICPSYTNIKSQFVTHGAEDQLKLSKEPLKIPYNTSTYNRISRIDSHSQECFNANIGKVKKPDLYVFGEDNNTFKILKERTTSISNPVSKKQFPHTCGDSVSEFENYRDDPFQIPMERHRNTLSNPLRKLGLSEFGDSVSEFGDYKYNSVNPLTRRTGEVFSNPLRKQIPSQFGESTSEFNGNYNDDPFQTPMSNLLKKTAIGEDNLDFGVKILTERNRHAASNLTRKQYLNPLNECDSDFANHENRPNRIPVERSKTASFNPPRKQMPCTFGESVSEFDDYNEFRIPTERPRDTFTNQLRRPSQLLASACNDSEFEMNEEDEFNIPIERHDNHYRSSSNRKTSQVVNYARETRIRNPSKNHIKSTNDIPCSTFVEREIQSVDYYDDGAFKIPGERAIKRKVMQREELNESEYKKSRFEESRFSTASNVVSSSTKICNFFNGKGNNTQSRFSIMKSSMISPVSKVTETVELINVARSADNLSNGTKSHNRKNCNIRSNYFSDNDHGDTVISSHHYTTNKEIKQGTGGGISKLNDPKSKDGEESKSNKKYIICEDDSFSAKTDNNEQRVCDDDTFFFKGSYTKPSVFEETTSNRMLPDTSKINSLYSASTSSRQPALNNPSNFLGSRPPRMDSVNSSVASRYRSLDSKGGNDARFHVSRSDGDHRLHPVSDNATVKTRLDMQNKYTLPKQMGSSDIFQKPAPVETISDKDGQQTTTVNRAVNCSPWRFINW